MRPRVPEKGSLLWELRQVHKQLVRLEERVGDLYSRAIAEARRNVGGSVGSAPHAASAGAGVATGNAEAAMRSLSVGVRVRSAVAAQRGDGSVWVKVDDARPLLLPPHLGTLWLALAEDTGLSRDEAVAFKSLRALSVRIGKRTGMKGPSANTINKYVCRLRQSLAAHGVDPEIVQTSRRLGRRVAVRPGARGDR